MLIKTRNNRFPRYEEFEELEENHPAILGYFLKQEPLMKKYLQFIKERAFRRKHNAEVIRRDVRKAHADKRNFSDSHIRYLVESVLTGD